MAVKKGSLVPAICRCCFCNLLLTKWMITLVVLLLKNGSPLFSGGTASGESQIRRWMLENDLIEAIIALPTDLFYNTGIATHISGCFQKINVLERQQDSNIDAVLLHKLRKALGDKKNEISPEDRSTVTKSVQNLQKTSTARFTTTRSSFHREYTVMRSPSA